MLKSFLFFSIFYISNTTFAQTKYWQQQVDFAITVSLNDKEHTLDGFENITYTNNSPDTLTYIWMHVWMNAYKNDQTAFCAQQLQHGNTKFYFSSDAERGYTNRLKFQIDNKTVKVEDHPNYIDIIKLILPNPLPPGKVITITTPFHTKLPYNFSRGGHVAQHYQITQWYPKPAVYDSKGWHPMPYLDQGEFYSEFGNYEVSITLPKNYLVAATGELQNEEEKEWLKQQAVSSTNINYTPFKEIKKQKIKFTTKSIKPLVNVIASSTETKTITFKQNNIIDFAWFADKEFKVQQDSLLLENGKQVHCQIYYLEKNKDEWNMGIAALKNAIKKRSTLIGVYPFSVVTAVDAQMGFDGGMEYPTITSIGGNYKKISVYGTIDHEVGHNWNQGVLASNERDYPWMDEGVNTYYDGRWLMQDRIKDTAILKRATAFIPKKKKHSFLGLGMIKPYEILDILGKGQSINTSSQNFSLANYDMVAYEKTADWLKLIENKIGMASMDSTLKAYYEQWKFKHPNPEDFDAAFKNYAIYKDSLQALRNQTGSLTGVSKVRKLNILPIIGLNQYDGFQLGVGIHNYTLHKTNFRFFAMPMYAFKSKQVNGLGRIAYNYYPTKVLKRIDMGIAAAKFSQNAFKESNLTFGFTKIAPFVRFTFKEKNKLSPIERYIQLKHFNITEDLLKFTTVENPPIDTTYVAGKEKNNYYVNQLQLSIKRYSVLYPYQLQIQIEQNKDLLRTTITAEEYFNYNAKEGLQVRLFAGKISYLKTKTSTLQYANDRYALNLLAPKGNEDYTYSTYFYARNAFENAPSYQILNRDGFFKFRTDLLANKPGRTDNWIAAANLVSDIPARLNPLSMLPFRVPLQLFMDIGTYAEAWKKNATDVKFIYDAGLQLSLLKGTIEIYWPLIYSKAFKDYSLQTNGKKRSA
jgi:Peptidase family M1 domain